MAVIKGVASSIGLNDLRIEPFGGRNNLRKFLKTFRARPFFTRNLVDSIGIIRDADDDGNAAFQSVCEALRQNDLEASKAKVRVWMASHVDWEYHVGKAAEEGYWPWANPAFDALKNFLRAL